MITIERLVEMLNNHETMLADACLKESWKTREETTVVQIERKDRKVYTQSALVCSKKYMFIKWLVIINAFDFKKIYEAFPDFLKERIKKGKTSKEVRYENILMFLAIQDNPIEFLLSVIE